MVLISGKLAADRVDAYLPATARAAGTSAGHPRRAGAGARGA
ncbi:MAG: hypothetical protein JWP82_1314, partial [Humibacillus sp.]|nr:hypothetical protein [Humibacillus sp.]